MVFSVLETRSVIKTFMPCWGLCVMSFKATQFTLPEPVLIYAGVIVKSVKL